MKRSNVPLLAECFLDAAWGEMEFVQQIFQKESHSYCLEEGR